MQKNNDYLRNRIRIPEYDVTHSGLGWSISTSLDVLEHFKISYKNIKWDFIESFIESSAEIIPIEGGWAAAIDTSGYDQFQVPRILLTGTRDFDLDSLSRLIDKLTRSEQLPRHLATAWSDCIYREFSSLNMSLIPIVDQASRPKSFMMPIFLYNLSRYYEGKSNQLFETYIAVEKTMLRAYLDSAFEEPTFGNKLNHLENYCSRVLFIEDPQIINALINFGELAQNRLNHSEEIIQSVDELESFIHLVLWYWAEKEVNILMVTL